MLRPWTAYPADSDPDPVSDSGVSFSVFGRQLGSWRIFRDWQKFNRDNFIKWDNSYYKMRAAYNRFVSVFRRRYPTYTETIKNLFTEYSFTRLFQFHKNPI